MTQESAVSLHEVELMKASPSPAVAMFLSISLRCVVDTVLMTCVSSERRLRSSPVRVVSKKPMSCSERKVRLVACIGEGMEVDIGVLPSFLLPSSRQEATENSERRYIFQMTHLCVASQFCSSWSTRLHQTCPGPLTRTSGRPI